MAATQWVWPARCPRCGRYDCKTPRFVFIRDGDVLVVVNLDRQRAGIEKAKAAGIYKGRPVSLDHARLLKMHNDGIGATEIAKAMKCSRSAVYKVLNAA